MYQEKSKVELQGLCRQKSLSDEGKKHHRVERLVKKLDLAQPPPLDVYDGQLHLVPDAVTEIAKMSVCRLREILRYHNILDCGMKDELALRVGMLRGGRSYLAFYKELEAIRNLMTAARNIMSAQKELYLCDPTVIHKRRKFATPTGASVGTLHPRDSASIPSRHHNSFLRVPEGIVLENLEEVLDPVIKEISIYEKSNWAMNESTLKTTYNAQLGAMRAVGARVLAQWSKDEVGTSGWKTGMSINTIYTAIKRLNT